MFVEVQASDYVRDECEKRAYRSSHYQQTLRILGVAAGTFAGQTIDVVAVDAMGVATQVGDLAVVGATNIDGVWFATGRVPIEMVASDAVPVDHVRSSVSRIVYDLPTNFAEFSQEAETVWSDYPTACGLPQPEGERADSELRSLFYDKDCPEIPVGENSNEEVVDGPTDVSP